MKVVYMAPLGSDQSERRKDNRNIVFWGSRDLLAYDTSSLCSRDLMG